MTHRPNLEIISKTARHRNGYRAVFLFFGEWVRRQEGQEGIETEESSEESAFISLSRSEWVDEERPVSSTRRLGVAIEGAGNVSTEHIRAYQRNPHTEVVAIGSRREEGARAKAAQVG